jgi:hypothetical protein
MEKTRGFTRSMELMDAASMEVEAREVHMKAAAEAKK